MFEQEEISKQELTEETESFFPSPFAPFTPVELSGSVHLKFVSSFGFRTGGNRENGVTVRKTKPEWD